MAHPHWLIAGQIITVGTTFLVTPDKAEATYLAKVTFVSGDFLRVHKLWVHPEHAGPGNRVGDPVIIPYPDMEELVTTGHALLDYAFDTRTGELIDPEWVSGIVVNRPSAN